jgi:hypothetical protein
VEGTGIICGDGKLLIQKKNVILMGEAKLPKKMHMLGLHRLEAFARGDKKKW